MDFSLPFRRDSTLSDTVATESSQPRSITDNDALLGEYIGISIASGIRRSIMGHSDRLKLLGEGSAFQAFRSSIREKGDKGDLIAKPIAVKMLRGSPSGTDPLLYPHKAEFRKKQLEALLREMRVLCNPSIRNHETIVHLQEWGFSTVGRTMGHLEDPQWQISQPYLVLEFAEHSTLEQFRNGGDCFDFLRDLALDVASGLEALHACEIAHGDLKLENILVFSHPQRGYCAKLSDFSHSITSATQSVYLGTERYRPPELHHRFRNEALTFDNLLRCDVWNFGVAVFELLTGSEMDGDPSSSDWSVDVLLKDPMLQDVVSQKCERENDAFMRAINSSLDVDPLRRATMQMIRVVLDLEDRCQVPSGRSSSLKPPTVLQVVAQYALCDEKYWLQKWLVHASIYGPKAQRSHYCFQLAQGHFNGFGFGIDIGKAMMSYAFAAKEPDEPSDPTAISLSSRIIGVPLNGHGPYSSTIASAEAIVKGSEETYYARRIRTFRVSSSQQLKSLPLIADESPDECTFTEVSARVRNAQAPRTITVPSTLLDLEIQAQLRLLDFLCLVGDLEPLEDFTKYQDTIDFEVPDNNGNTALQYACMGGHAHIVKYLVEQKGVKVDVKSNVGTTPLHWLPFFSAEDIPEMAKLLCKPITLDAMSTGCRIPIHLLHLRGTPLQWSVSCRSRQAMETLLDLGADINAEYDGYTALGLASEIHAFELVELLLSSGTAARNLGPHKRSAMHFITGNAPIIRRQCIHGSNGIALAAMKTIATLEKYGCGINVRDKHNNTPLHKAVASPLERGDLYLVKALLLSGADRNAQNVDGDTVLHIGVKLSWVDQPNHKQLLSMLIDDEQAFLDEPLKTVLTDKDGRTPHMVAAFLHVNGIEKIIPLHQDDLIQQDKNGNYIMGMIHTPFKESFDYIRDFKGRLRELGLAVTLDPECS